MLLKQEILDKLEIIYNAIKEHCIGIYVGGSFGISYLNSYHDIDIFIVCPNLEERKIVFKMIRKDNQELKNKVDYLKEKYNAMVLTTTLFDQQHFFGSSYQFHYKNDCVVFGQEINFAQDILGNKNDYIQMLKYLLEKVHYFKEKKNIILKDIYHILTGIYILQNNSYDFTSEQIENINICHEEKDQDKMRILLEWCTEWLSKQK